MKLICKRLFMLLGMALLLVPLQAAAGAADRAEAGLPVPPSPQRLVSLIPTVTDIIRALDAEARLVGLTLHDLPESAGADPRVVGGFFAPSPELIAALEPDLIIHSDLHAEVRERFQGHVALLDLGAGSLEQAFDQIALLGRLLDRTAEAEALLAEHRGRLALIAEQLKTLPADRRPRMMRLMGTDPLAAPGDDSFQNDFIRAAGATPPAFGRNGSIIALTVREIEDFDPQVIYVCGEQAAERVLHHAMLQGVAAVREGRVVSFPCDLTCRAGVDIGDFVTRLARAGHGDLPFTPAGAP